MPAPTNLFGMPFPPLPEIFRRRHLSVDSVRSATGECLLDCYAWMLLGRTVDNRILELFRQGLIRGTVTGGQGNEGLCAPIALLAQRDIDVVSFSHRGLAGHLVWSGHPCDHINQYLANAASPTKAREGNIHHGDPANRSLPMISHLGAMVSCVAGATDSQRRNGRQAVGFAFFGDGSSSTGDVHETLNLASLLSLPVIFLIENNRYAYSTPLCEQHAPGTELWRRAEGYRMEARSINCSNTEELLTTLAEIVADVRARPRPVLVEAATVRLRGHAAYDTGDYLLPGEPEAFAAADPLPRLRARLVEGKGEEPVAAVDHQIAQFVEECLRHCLALPRPKPDQQEDDLFAKTRADITWKPCIRDGETTSAQPLNQAQALNAALHKILSERGEALVLGQDIATYGGAFKVTDGLLGDFGRHRVFNTPLAESACTGYALGMAMNSHRPIFEYQFADFCSEAFTQITLNAATLHFRSGAKAPLVFRLPSGGGLTMGSFHSQELESTLLSMPGLKALYPSCPQDAFDALLAAYEDDNPVLVFEHKGLYRKGKAPVSWNPEYRSVWQPRLLVPGSFATLVTYGECTLLAAELAAYFKEEYEVELEVWDLRALSPLNLDGISESLGRTHRLIVLHEGRLTHGFGAEVVARLSEKHFFDLEAPPLRLAATDIPVPFAPELEQAFRPGFDSCVAKIADWIG